MNTRIYVSLSFLCLFLVSAKAQTVPALVNYQGRLANPDGTALATGDYQLTFRVYDSASNSGGLIWGPQVFDGVAGQGHGGKIPVVQGYFNVMLGPLDTNGVSLADAFNATNRYVEIRVGTNNPVLPRQQILSAPFAFQAANAEKLAGADWSAVFGTNDPLNGRIPTTKLVTNGTISAQKININSSNSQGVLNVNGDLAIENGYELQLNSSDNSVAARIKNSSVGQRQLGFIVGAPLFEAMTIKQTGNVGINTTNPATALDVNGTVKATSFSGSGAGLTGLNLTNMAARQVGTNVGVGGVAISQSSGVQNIIYGSIVDVTNLQVTITTSGRPVLIFLTGDTNAPDLSFLRATRPQNASAGGDIYIHRDVTTQIYKSVFASYATGATANEINIPPGAVSCIDTPSPGTHTYQVKAEADGGTSTFKFNYIRLVAFEL